MSESLWSLPAEALLRRTASDEPAPGSGAAASVAGAFGLALVVKALVITDDDGCAAVRARAEALLERVVASADRDAEAFAALVEARGAEADDGGSDTATDAATARAAAVPLDLADALVEAIALAEAAAPLVKEALVSDARAGAELLRAAARTALLAASLNVDALESRDASGAGSCARRPRASTTPCARGTPPRSAPRSA